MGTRDDEFVKKLVEAFKVETDEHLRVIENSLLELENASDIASKLEIIETMYREAHSLKGAARSVDLRDIESICQALESVFAELKADRIAASAELFDTLHRASDIIGKLVFEEEEIPIQEVVEELSALASLGLKQSEFSELEPNRPLEVGKSESRMSDGSMAKDSPKHPKATEDTSGSDSTAHKSRPLGSETVRISVDKLDHLLRQAGEMVAVKLTAEQRSMEIADLLGIIDKWKQNWSSVSSHERTVGKLLLRKNRSTGSIESNVQMDKLVEFLEWNVDIIKSLEAKLKTLLRESEADSRMHGAMVNDLLDDMMNVMMLPCSSFLEMFPKLVRDLARERHKEVNLVVEGGDLEIDRRILVEMKDPLIHLVRNCIDHGIEAPDEREYKGKDKHGTITITIAQVSGNQIELVVSDDGAGIDEARVREAAVRRGAISELDSSPLEGQDALSLVFHSEVSTSPEVSTLSGRGLGLAIVREKVRNLGGNISLSTAPNTGASFRILLPVTLSTFRGILVEVSDRQFVLPTAHVERVGRIPKELIKTVGNRDTIEVDGHAMPLVSLNEVLELTGKPKNDIDSDFIPVLMLRAGNELVSFRVDSVLQELEVLVKFLGKQLSRVRNVAGATVLGSGKLVPILNVPDLIKSATKSEFARINTTVAVKLVESKSKNVLVVEDSITSRMLLKNVLETSGYGVKTSVDGLEALTALKSDNFDLVVSDVQMPRMDGFELTTKIRNDENLKDIPVILVTSLGSREDRERGIEVGANAYIHKGSFDQSNLLETVARLI